jgi:hypothetical protein
VQRSETTHHATQSIALELIADGLGSQAVCIVSRAYPLHLDSSTKQLCDKCATEYLVFMADF